MQQYIGTKTVLAAPMTRSDAEELLGRDIGGIREGDGYLVEYADGYQSWSPKDVFDEAYRPISAMTFGDALVMLKKGRRVARAGWNGKGMWLYLVSGDQLAKSLGYGFGEYLGEPTCCDSIAMKTADNRLVVVWTASQTDRLAEDWMLVD